MKWCSNCNWNDLETKATHFCFTCEEYFCNECALVHNEEWDDKAEPIQEPKCQD